MRQAVTKDLYAYWNGLRGARAAPDRADINPSLIKHLLADAFLIEVDDDLEFPITLSGTRINSLWLSDQQGRRFLDLWRKADHRSVAAAILTAMDGATPIVAGAKIKTRQSPASDLELLLLPLRHFGRTHARLLGCLSPLSPPGWLGLTAAEPLELHSMRVIREHERQTELQEERQGVSFAARREAPRLIVYEGGKSPRL